MDFTLKNFNYAVKFVSSQIYFPLTFQLASSKGTDRTFRRIPGRAVYNIIKTFSIRTTSKSFINKDNWETNTTVFVDKILW